MDIKQVLLSETEVEFISVSERDEIGKVFSYNNKILRAIYKHKVDYVNQLLNSGLIDELVDKGMFPKTTISNYELEGFGMVLEHEKIQPVVMPPQWSFDMLKDAGILAIEINEIAKKYGYQTMDCHSYNILFSDNKPVYVDLGSFIIHPKGFKGWFAYENFLQCYYYPLKMIESGNGYLGRLIMSQNSNMPHYSYYYFKYSLAKIISQDKIDLFLSYLYKFKLINYFSREEIAYKTPGILKKLTLFLHRTKLLPFQRTNLNKLKNKINSISIPNTKTEWGDYHNVLKESNGMIKSTPRFDRILEILRQLEVCDVLEIGGNQGVFSMIISERSDIPTIICTDYDETAVNIMYKVLKKTNHRVTPALLNFFSPNENNFGGSVYYRFRSETVLALALTHHLILTQKMSIRDILERLIKFSKKYVMIEFMPLGLYSPTSKRKYIVPEWYNVDWFRNNFSQYFHIINEEHLEKNRILFVGEIKSQYLTID
jgi:hypothetical protein